MTVKSNSVLGQKISPIKKCSICSNTLSGRQRKYCSKECQHEGYRGISMRTFTCGFCKITFERIRGKSNHQKYCSIQCVGKAYRKFPSRAIKKALRKDNCEICNFVPIHIGQLDLDHIDGNKLNYAEDNLQTLCANCHRLKTIMNGDHMRPSYNGEGKEL